MHNTGLYLISGFLGAGKTTLVKRLLEEKKDLKIGIVMNEFGRVSVDGPILKSDTVEMVELTRGSIFCSCLSMAFAEALVDISNKDLDYVIVESSGLADPSNIGTILEGVAQLADKPYDYLGSITVVDAAQFLQEVDTIETLSRQIECADLTYINKIDLISEKEREDIKEKIMIINPETQCVETTFFKGIENVIGKPLAKKGYRTARESLNTPENKPKTISLHFTEDIAKEDLEKFMREILPSALRIKGFVKLSNQWWEVHGVGACVDFYESSEKMPESTLVLISKIGPSIIREVDQKWSAIFGFKIKMKN